MVEYKSNSNKSKEKLRNGTEDKKLEKVIKGNARIKKKSEVRKFADIFLPEDVSNVKKYIISDILIPSVKSFISDSVNAFLYPNGGGPRRSTVASKINYSGISTSRASGASRNVNNVGSGFDYDNIIFDTRGDAAAVLMALEGAIDQFGTASVGDLYDLAQVTTTNYAVNKYGWNDLRSAQVVGVRDGGFMIKLPRALPLN